MDIQSVDAGPATVETLLKVAIRLEAAAQRFYEGLAKKFSTCPEVAKFWWVMAAEEACHKNRLTEWGASISVARLSQPSEVRMLQMGEKLLDVSVPEMLEDVRNLDDAYEMAHDLESSETNAIFRFFITEFCQDPRVLAVLMRDLDEHVERLMTGFPSQYATKAARADTQALRQ